MIHERLAAALRDGAGSADKGDRLRSLPRCHEQASTAPRLTAEHRERVLRRRPAGREAALSGESVALGVIGRSRRLRPARASRSRARRRAPGREATVAGRAGWASCFDAPDHVENLGAGLSTRPLPRTPRRVLPPPLRIERVFAPGPEPLRESCGYARKRLDPGLTGLPRFAPRCQARLLVLATRQEVHEAGAVGEGRDQSDHALPRSLLAEIGFFCFCCTWHHRFPADRPLFAISFQPFPAALIHALRLLCRAMPGLTCSRGIGRRWVSSGKHEGNDCQHGPAGHEHGREPEGGEPRRTGWRGGGSGDGNSGHSP